MYSPMVNILISAGRDLVQDEGGGMLDKKE
jgi:hypothetical protein